MTDRQRIETTYADLRPDDQIEDKSGNRWLLASLVKDAGTVGFWLCDIVTNIKLHNITKNGADPVTVWRLPKHADQVAQLEAETPESDPADYGYADLPRRNGIAVIPNRMPEDEICRTCKHPATEHSPGKFSIYGVCPVTAEEAVETVTEQLGATVDIEATAAEVDAAIVAEDTGIPVEILAFEDMTDLEKRSHLYVLHGVIAYDLQSRLELTNTHNGAHSGEVMSRTVPHTHLAAS
jgi:hypothetical protein